jgi:hypothetical protein
MARGWESKAVADQIEEGNEARTRESLASRTPQELLKASRLASLLLSKSRLLEQLERAKHPSHREVLLNGLKAIEKEIETIGNE